MCCTNTDGDPDGTFLISQTTGKMYLRRPLDFESMSDTVYNVTVEATDGEFNSSAVVTITITDVNDNVPECTPTFVNVTIDENMQIGFTVTHFTSKFDICFTRYDLRSLFLLS